MRRVENDGEGMDRVSALPDWLIEEILSFLEMRDVVRTSLLSRRWKNLWSTTPCLDFDESGKNSVQTRNFINGVLLRWEGSCIRRFKINLSSSDEFDHASLSGDMDLWVSFATKKRVKELYINLPCDYRKPLESSSNIPVYLPHQSYSSITKLCIVGCNLEINVNVNVNERWDQLKSLEIHGYCDIINQVVSSAPQLEILDARLLGRRQNLSIQSSSLKRLTLDIKYLPSDQSKYTKLTIRAPNLEALAISGAAYTKCLKVDISASSLTHAALEFENHCPVTVIEETLTQIIPGIQHVESLTLSLYCFKLLGVIKIGPKNSCSVVLGNVKILEVIGGPIDACDIVSVNEIFPKVEKLMIDWKLDSPFSQLVANLSLKDIDDDDDDDQDQPKKRKKVVRVFLTRLRIIEITWYSYKASMFRIIKFMLKYATRVVKTVIREGGGGGGGGTTADDHLQGRVLAAQQLVALQNEFKLAHIST